MSGFQITVTAAGRAAQVNAENTGTAPVTIAQVGITDQAVVADEAMTALPGELKRLVTFAGAAVAADTIHVTIRDDSADVYSMRGFGLYLSDGTLYAVYGQADVILEKSAQAMMLLAADIIFANIDATSLTFGDTNWINPPATTEVQGVVELATPSEANTGIDPTRAVTSVGLKHTLDTRFGIGSPTAFVKGLLSLATAALLRTALEIKSAALKDTGAGNGLDADLVDGQHGAYYLEWENQTGVPLAFPPAAHVHSFDSLSGKPATATRWPTYTEVSDKPLTYPPSGHSHDAGAIVTGTFDVARIPDIAIGKVAGLTAALQERYTKGEIGVVPFTSGTAYSGLKGNSASGDSGLMVANSGTQSFLIASSLVRLQAGTGQLSVGNGGASIVGALSASGGFQDGSSRKLKTRLRRNPYGLAAIEQIETRVGYYKKAYNADGRRRLFLIAEQLRKIIPEAVVDDAIEFNGERVPAVEYAQTIPSLIESVKELSALNRKLSARVRKLESRKS